MNVAASFSPGLLWAR